MREANDKPAKNGGYIYPLGVSSGREIFTPPKPMPLPNQNCEEIFANLKEDYSALVSLSDSLGVDVASLVYLEARYSRGFHAWAFPMRNAEEKIVGIRLRDETGKKWAVRGSHQGLFIPRSLKSETLVICEGPTDTAAALTLGYFAIGRPSCATGEEMINSFIRLRKIHRVIVIPDNDTPGIEGAERLTLNVPHLLWIPPKKDLRDFLRSGGKREIIDSALKDMVWNMPQKKKDSFQRNYA